MSEKGYHYNLINTGTWYAENCTYVLDQNVNDNAYSTPLLHEALYVDHKMVMLGIGLYHNIFTHICVQHQHYPEHDIICLSIFFYFLFFHIFPNQ